MIHDQHRGRRFAWFPRVPIVWFGLAILAATVSPGRAADTNQLAEWLTRPLSLAGALDIAASNNAAIRKARKDLETRHGQAVQTRAVLLPRVRGTSDYRVVDPGLNETFRLSSFRSPEPNDQSWRAGLQIVQSIYEGGRVQSSLRTARLLREQALLDYQTVVADTLLAVRVSYDDALLATNEIVVREASVALLAKQLDDTRRRFDAGVVPQFNVLRAEVELANARPPLIRARNAFRIAKQRLAHELGFHVPRSVPEDLPLNLTGQLAADSFPLALSAALTQALRDRTELASLLKAEALRKEGVTTAKAGSKPSVQLFAGYGARSRQFNESLSDPLHGWEVGAQASWDIFDGRLTKGKVQSAVAQHERVLIDLEDVTRRIELEVRTAWSTYVEAKEVLESQQKVTEQAVEALRLANTRYEAGAGTQLDVLSAQTALTEARTTVIRSLHDYSVARARLDRATGLGVTMEKQP